MTKRWNLLIDVAKCENCHNCSLAVKDEHIGNTFPGYAAPQPKHGHEWIRIERRVRGAGSMVDAAYLPTMCNHCDEAPCVKHAPDVVQKREDGIVLIDPEKARGRRDIVDACPYGAIWWNEEQQLPQAWIFDAHLLDQGWREPRCAQSCPTGAIRSLKVDDSEMRSLVEQEKLDALRPELGTKPRVYYRNLYRFTKCFIGGSVTAPINGVSECIEGAHVALLKDGTSLAEATTDMFGDFKFDGLDSDSGVYRVEITQPQLGKASVAFTLGVSQYIENIVLSQ